MPPYVRPLLSALLIIGTGLAAVLLLSRPQEKDVTVSAKCNGLVLPVEAHTQLNDINYFETVGYEANISRIDSIEFNGNTIAPRDVTLSPSNPSLSPPPVFNVKLGPQAGPVTLDISDGIGLLAKRLPDQQAALQVNHGRSGEVILSVETDRMDLRAFYASTLGQAPQQAQLTLLNQRFPVHAEFHSLKPIDPEKSMYLSVPFSAARSLAVVSLSPDPKTIRVKPLLLSQCSSFTIDSAHAEETKLSDLESVKVIFDHFRSMSADIESCKEPASLCRLTIKFAGSAKSIVADDRERLPTMLEAVLSKSPQTKGLYAFFGAIAVLVGGIFLKRAMEILAKLFMPEA